MNTDLIIYQGTQNIITDTTIDYLDIVWKMTNKSKYSKWYIGIIKNAQSRNFKTRKTANEKIGFVEQHHILPKSIVYNDEKSNLVFLTPKEHFVVHHLLIKMFDNKKFNEKMILAFWFFVNGSRNNVKITATTYSSIKEKSLLINKNYLSGEQHPLFGKKGENHPAFGYIHSDETKQRISTSNTGQKRTDETRLNISNSLLGENHPMFGKHLTEEHKEKISIALLGENGPFYGRHHTDENKQKMSEIKLGENNPFYGRVHSSESKQKMSEYQSLYNPMRGKTQTEKSKKQMSMSMKIKRAKDKLNVDIFEKWIIDNELPADIIWTGKIHGFPEKLYYIKELNKRGILKIEV